MRINPIGQVAARVVVFTLALFIVFSASEHVEAQGRRAGHTPAPTTDLEQRISRIEAALNRLERSNSGDRFQPERLSGSSPIQRVEHIQNGLPAAPAPAGGADGRLIKVEEWIEKFQAGLDKKKADDAKKPTFRIGGRIHADYWGFADSSPGIGFFENPDATAADFGDDPESRFVFRRIRLETRGDIFENMMWRIQVDFNNPSSAEIKDVWIGFKNLPCNHELLIGNQKRPIGLDHLNSSRFNVFTERPLVVEAFNEDARRPGIALYGNTCDNSWGWVFGGYLLENISRDGRYIGDSTQGSLNARLFNSPWYENDGRDYYHWAIAGMFAKPDGDRFPTDTNANDGRFRTRPEARSSSRWIDTGRVAGADWYEVLALESLFNAGPLQIVSEYQFSWMQRDGSTPGTGPDVYFHGAYVYVAYFLTGEHIPYNRQRGTIGRVVPNENFWLANWCCGCRGGGWGAWQLAARYSYLDLTSNDIQGGVEHNFEVALNWHWTSHSRLQFGVIYGDIEQHRPVGGYTSGDFLIAGARFAADF